MIYFPGQALLFSAVTIAVCSSILLVYPGWWPLIVILWIVLLFFVFRDYRRLSVLGKDLKAGIDVPDSCQRGDIIHARLQIQNQSPSRQNIKIRPLLPEQAAPRVFQRSIQIDSNTTATLPCPIKAFVQGDYRFGDIVMRAISPLSLLQVQFTIPGEQTTRVLPNVSRVRDYLHARRSNMLIAPHMRTAKLKGIGSEFESLRDYEKGDDIRRIDWRATAKHSKLITRNYEIEPFRNVLIVIDRGRLMAATVGDATKLDLAIDAALMIAGVVLDSGDRCGIMVFDKSVHTFIKPQPSLRHLTTIVDAVYNIQPVLEESHFQSAFVLLQKRLLKRSMIIVLTNMVDVDASGSMLKAMVTLSKRHLLLMGALQTPEVHEVISASTSDAPDPFRKAVAYRLIKERNQVVSSLQSSGVHVLDLMPSELTVPLINKYIELREQNLL